MKKSSTILIASILVILHLLAFVALVRQKNTGDSAAEIRKPAQISEPVPEPEPKSILSVLDPPLEPLEIVSMDTGKTIVKVDPPVSPAGHLQKNRPDRRTDKVYSKLIGDPYQGAIVVDARTGRVLFEDRASVYAYPASVTKLMTLLIVLEQAEAKRIALSDMVRITAEVSKIGGSQAYLDPKETFSVDEMIYALIVHSANDAARALSLHVAGSMDAFIKMMNRRAREIGMNSTVYHTDHGLPPGDGRQPDISTAYDIALLSMEVLKHKDALRYTGTELTYLRDGKFMLATRNALAKRVDGYPGCDGLKTGYHSAGGWSLAATAERNGKRIIAVALGCPDKESRTKTVTGLLDRGFQALEK
ncbi:MAG: D-alanyl-D-alanine carboxypeptidase [Kiritimatiellales bacterium]|nr:D-alanyl-D-alanine carboxypeptidase [Kiritimatiellales bacterium]